MKRTLLFSLAVGSVTLSAACGDDDGPGVVAREPLAIVGEDPVQLMDGTVGVDYMATVTATGGTSRLINWTLLDELPTGLYITSQLNPLIINGRPRVAGDYSFRLQVTDSGEEAAVKSFNISIAPEDPELAITTENDPPQAQLNEPYGAFQFEASGGSGSGYVFSADPNELPPGMLLESDGTLTGTPGREGTFPFQVRVRDSVGATAEARFELVVSFFVPEFVFLTEDCPDGKADEPYECEFELEGGIQPYDLAVGAGGGVPPGLELIPPEPDSFSGLLRGVPLEPGNYAFQIRASDSNRAVERQSFFVFIDEADPPLRITGRVLYPDEPDEDGEPTERFELTGFEVNRETNVELVAIGGSEEGYQWSRLSGEFPPGCTFTSSTPNAQLSCIPTRVGCFDFELRVTDDEGTGESSVPRTFTLCVRPEVFPLSIPSATGLPGVTVLPEAELEENYQAEITADGGLPATGLGYGWSVVPADGLPPGMSIFRNGNPSTFLRGTATATGTYDFNLSVYDAENRTTTAPFRLVVTSTTPI